MRLDRLREWLARIFFALLLFTVIYLLVQQRLQVPPRGRLPLTVNQLPYYSLLSFYRMLAAYMLALAFSLAYGMAASLKRGADRLMLPILDVLQSVPVLGFFPAATLLFISLFHGARIGIELASIFLIFTSQAWNMTFGVYESLTTIPKDLHEASQVYGLRGETRRRRLLMPACTSKLVYNSILSWAGGWYFLIATEIIASGALSYRLPGLGTFLFVTSAEGKLGLTLAGLGALISIIITMDLLLWRPLTVWAQKFRYEYAGGAPPVVYHSVLLGLFNRVREVRPVQAVAGGIWAVVRLPGVGAAAVVHWWRRAYETSLFVRRLVLILGRLVVLALLVFIAYLSYWLATSLVRLFQQPLPPAAYTIPGAIVASAARLAFAYLISLAWTLPIAVKIADSPRAGRVLMPLFQVSASMPATALFPLMVLLVVRYTGNINLVAILLVLTGMQWYLLFNLVAGTTSIPNDLREAAGVFRLKGWLYWRRVILPAVFPSLVTGSITAWGGGWNALIVAEYFAFKGRVFKVFGVGSLLDQATFATHNSQMIFLSLVGMVVTIALLNRLFWRPLYHFAARRFTIEY